MRTRTIVTLGLLAIAIPARAEELDEPPPAPAAEVATVAPGERVTLPAKRVIAHANLEISLVDGSAFDPVSLSPDVWYGVNDKLTVGLVHSSMAVFGVIGGIGDSLCLTGDQCDSIYPGFGLDARYELLRGKVVLAGNAGLQTGDLDPFQLRAKLGVVGRFRPSPTSKLAVDFTPALFFGLTEREPSVMGAQPNKELLVLPATALYQVIPKLSAGLQLALVLPFEDAGDFYFVPLSVGATYQIDPQIWVDAAFTLLRLAGGDGFEMQGGTGFDARTFTVGGGYAF